RAHDRTRLEGEPEKISVGSAQSEVLHKPAAALFDHAIKRSPEAIAVERMQDFEPNRSRSFERAALQAEHVLGLRAGEHLVCRYVPVPDQITGAGQRKRAAFHVRN